MKLITQNYPLTISYKQAEQLVNNIGTLVKRLKGKRELTKKEYKLLNDVTASLLHPHKTN